MDSAYAHGVYHLFGAVWKQKGIKKTNVTSIQHMTEITNLMTAMMRPHKLAIIKCQAHKKGNDFMIKGNNVADKAAHEASGCSVAVMAPFITVEPHITLNDIAAMQDRAPPNEKLLWEHRVNGTLKAKIVKVYRQTGLKGVDALPLALMHYRTLSVKHT